MPRLVCQLKELPNLKHLADAVMHDWLQHTIRVQQEDSMGAVVATVVVVDGVGAR